MASSGDSSNTLSPPPNTTSKMEEEIRGPFIDRYFSTQPSIFASSEMDIPRAPGPGRSEAVIRRRLANAVAAFSASDIVSDEISNNHQITRKQSNTGNTMQNEDEPLSAIMLDPEAARTQRSVISTSTMGQPATPTHRRRLPRRSPTSLQFDTSKQTQRGIQVYEDRFPATTQVSLPFEPDAVFFHPYH
jgi:hypothetical protein